MGKMKQRWCCLYCVEYSCLLNRCTLHDVMVEDKHTNVCDNYEGGNL